MGGIANGMAGKQSFSPVARRTFRDSPSVAFVGSFGSVKDELAIFSTGFVK